LYFREKFREALLIVKKQASQIMNYYWRSEEVEKFSQLPLSRGEFALSRFGNNEQRAKHKQRERSERTTRSEQRRSRTIQN
jgi:hypothetical protein